MYFSNICKSLVHARSSWRHEDYTAEWADIASALKDSWPPLPNFSLEWCIDSHMQRHTHTHTSTQVLFLDLFQRKKSRNFKVTAYCSEKQRSWMFHWYISDVILHEWRVSMQLDCENDLPTGIQRKKENYFKWVFPAWKKGLWWCIVNFKLQFLNKACSQPQQRKYHQ